MKVPKAGISRTAIAQCPKCGWARSYPLKQHAKTGLIRHLARDCQPGRAASVPIPGKVYPPTKAMTASEKGWVAAANSNGYRRISIAAWIEHPWALDDLMRVLGGTSTTVINRERLHAKRVRARQWLV